MERETINLDQLFKLIQRFLDKTPLLVWGSGATVPCGLPTMSELAKYIKDNAVPELDADKDFEAELCGVKYEALLPKIRRAIWDGVSDADLDLKRCIASGKSDTYTDAIHCLLQKFTFAHPRKLEILTTNYDRALEYVSAYYGLPFSDGTTFAELSGFAVDRFKNTDCINILKVHGSLSWFDINGDFRCMSEIIDDAQPMIIIPGKDKYRETTRLPYRDLIHRADTIIDDAVAFLVIGFGFNDEHITPKLINKVNRGVPIVVVTKNVKDQCRKSLQSARKMLMLEADANCPGQTLVTVRANKTESDVSYSVPGEYWRLPKFMEAL